MAMAMNEANKSSRRQPAARRTSSANAIVPPNSPEATARKLDVIATETETAPQPVLSKREMETQLRERQATFIALCEKRDEYIERLDSGAAKIEEARAQGKDVTTWEDYWIQLLRRYEAVCDKLRELNYEG